MNEQHFISLLSHLSQRLELCKKEIPDAMQARNPSLLHPPIKALTIAKEMNDALLHEINPLSEEEHDTTGWLKTLEDLQIDFSAIMFTIQDGLAYCFIDGPISYAAQIEEYREYCSHLVTKAIKKIKECIDPIIKKQLDDLKAEHGQPMAIAMPPYRPWDAPPPPETEIQRLFRNVREVDTAPCLMLQLESEPAKEHWRSCLKESSKPWPLCCASASRMFSQEAEALNK